MSGLNPKEGGSTILPCCSMISIKYSAMRQIGVYAPADRDSSRFVCFLVTGKGIVVSGEKGLL